MTLSEPHAPIDVHTLSHFNLALGDLAVFGFAFWLLLVPHSVFVVHFLQNLSKAHPRSPQCKLCDMNWNDRSTSQIETPFLWIRFF